MKFYGDELELLVTEMNGSELPVISPFIRRQSYTYLLIFERVSKQEYSGQAL